MGKRWQVLLRPAVDRIGRNLQAGMTAREAVADAWKATSANKVIAQELQQQVLRAAREGAGLVDSALSPPAFEKAILGNAWAGDNITTIVRLQRAPRQMQAAVAGAVRAAVIQGESVRTLALKISDNFFARPLIPTMAVTGDPLPAQLLDLIQRGVSGKYDPALIADLRKFRASYIDQLGGRFPDTSRLGAAYRDLAQKLEGATEAQLLKSIQAAVYQKARYLGERIARTEMARANWEGFAAQKFEDSQVVAIRFRLSPAHPKEDICDFMTQLDSGLGAGVYPKNQLPQYPFHPNCICWYEEIYAHELKGKEWTGAKAGAKRLLRSVPASSRAAMMGAKYRAKDFRRDPERALNLVAGWNGLSKLEPVIFPRPDK
jgi:hypothetical protein